MNTQLETNDAPMPRATDKELKTAKAKAALKVGKPKHKPDAATIAERNLVSGKALTPRQEDDVTIAKAARAIKKAASQVPDDVPRGTQGSRALTEWVNTRDEDGAPVKKAPALPGTPYHGPMLALRDRLKAGAYKKSANGQPSCGDDVAGILGTLEPVEVIRACCIALDIANPYLHLNIGQQSMNLRNKLRGALKNEKFGMGVLREAVEDVIEARPAPIAK